MNILTFDTVLDKMYLTFSEDNELICSKVIETDKDKYHSAYLTKTVTEILKENSITMQDVDAIGINSGPGSFTGIRACLTVARVMAQQLKIPLVGVSSLEILSKLVKTDKKVMVLLDARKNCAYQAIFQKGNELKEPSLINLDDLIQTDFSQFAIITDKNMQDFLLKNGIKSVFYEDQYENLGEFLAKISYNKLQSKEDFHFAKAKPQYIQQPSITQKRSLND